MVWCPVDSSYLITCAKDNQTICWDTISGEIVCELPAGTNWNFDVHWYPKIPGVISASSFDGKVGFYNIEGCSRHGVGRSEFGTEKGATGMAFENTQTQSAPIYGADQSNFGLVDASQSYQQETAPLHMQPSGPSNPYGGNYQHPASSSYGGGYGAPTSYQPPNIFLPSQTPSQPTFLAPPVTTQPVARPFIPATPAALKNVEQYHQPTLGSQLYPGTTNTTYQPIQPGTGLAVTVTSQPGAFPGHRMPQVVAPTPPPRGFIPVNSGVVQRPGIGSMQPPSPTQAASAQPTVMPAAPPHTVQTVDSSNVPVHQKPVIAKLTRLCNETSEALGGSQANATKKREIEDNSRKLGTLFAKLNGGDISKNAADKLVQLCQALDNGDFSTALQIQVLLTTSEWDECNFWLNTLKRMIKTRQNVRLN